MRGRLVVGKIAKNALEHICRPSATWSTSFCYSELINYSHIIYNCNGTNARQQLDVGSNVDDFGRFLT
jgi:hypothetical protein